MLRYMPGIVSLIAKQQRAPSPRHFHLKTFGSLAQISVILVTTGKIPNAAELSEVHGRPWDDVDVSEVLGVRLWNIALKTFLHYSIKRRNVLIMVSMAVNPKKKKNIDVEIFWFGHLATYHLNP